MIVLLHLGELHAFERWLAVGLAFGPFLLLALVIVLRRRQDAADDNTPVE